MNRLNINITMPLPKTCVWAKRNNHNCLSYVRLTFYRLTNNSDRQFNYNCYPNRNSSDNEDDNSRKYNPTLKGSFFKINNYWVDIYYNYLNKQKLF